jgi:hypothetical protein
MAITNFEDFQRSGRNFTEAEPSTTLVPNNNQQRALDALTQMGMPFQSGLQNPSLTPSANAPFNQAMPQGDMRVPQQFQGAPIGPTNQAPPVQPAFVPDRSLNQLRGSEALARIISGEAAPLSPNMSLEQRAASDARQQASPAPNIFNPTPQTAPQSQEALNILGEMSGVQGTMGVPQGATQFPDGGGTASEVGGLRPMTQPEVGAQQKSILDVQAGNTADKGLDAFTPGRNKKTGRTEFDVAGLARQLGGGAAGLREAKEIVRGQMMKEQGATSELRKIVKGLTEQGMTKDQILDAVGTPEQRAGMTDYQQFKKLNNLNKSRMKERSQSKNEQRRMERTRNKARYNEDGTPKNDAAVFIEHKRFADDTGADPESDTTNYDRMTASQKREYDRYQKLVTSGARVPNRMQTRMDKIQEEVQAKSEKEFEAKTAQQKEESRKSLIASRIASAQTAEESKYYSERERKIKAIDARKKTGGLSSKEKVELTKQKNKLNEEIMAGYTAPEVDSAPIVTTQEQFDALPSGAQYKNNSGQIATKP